MSSRLEQFIRDHREAFDAEEPPKRVWDHIRQQTEPGRKELQPVIWLSPRQWSVAAAVSLLIAASVWYFTHGNSAGPRINPTLATVNPAANTKEPGRDSQPSDKSAANSATGAQTNTPPPDTASGTLSTTDPAKGSSPATGAGREDQAVAQQDTDPATDYREEMGYYTGLVRLKHKELRTIEKDEPLLYKQFAGDINKLDSVYHALEKQLPQSPNHEQLMEAMLQDLQLQMRLLNHQLGIIKQINHSKKTAYEKAYKTI